MPSTGPSMRVVPQAIAARPCRLSSHLAASLRRTAPLADRRSPAKPLAGPSARRRSGATSSVPTSPPRLSPTPRATRRRPAETVSRAEFGSNAGISALVGPARRHPDRRRFHRLEVPGRARRRRCGLGPADRHQALAGRGGCRALGAACSPARRRAGPPPARPGRSRLRGRGPLGWSPPSSPSSSGAPPRSAIASRRGDLPCPCRRRRRRRCSSPSGRFASQLAATRRQASAYAGGRSRRELRPAHGGRLRHRPRLAALGLALGWVEELQPLTAPQPARPPADGGVYSALRLGCDAATRWAARPRCEHFPRPGQCAPHQALVRAHRPQHAPGPALGLPAWARRHRRLRARARPRRQIRRECHLGLFQP